MNLKHVFASALFNIFYSNQLVSHQLILRDQRHTLNINVDQKFYQLLSKNRKMYPYSYCYMGEYPNMSPQERECLVADFCTAAINGDLNTLEECYFIRFVDVEATDRNGWRAIHHAASYGHVHIVQGLVQKLRVNVNSRNSEGFTALHFACGNNHLNVVRCLVQDCRCNISLSTVEGFTVLDIARQLGNSDMVQFLEQHSLNVVPIESRD